MNDGKLPPAETGGTPTPPEPGPGEAPEVPAAARPLKFPIVGIGASAGGLEALESLAGRLSHDGMAFVVLQHLAPSHESILTEILARVTSLNVITARDGLEVAVNNVYVTPPGVELAIEEGVLRLSGASDRVPRHSIDNFFRTLASERGPAAIGVVLSGAGSDGTLGLRAIKEEGGITFAQDPSTASQASMPESALDAGCADFCLSPAQIGDELMRLSAHPYVARKRPPRLFGQDALARIFDRLHRAFAVDFSAYKLATIERRIERRMALQKVDKAESYLKLLEDNPDELSVLYSDLLIGVTGFFRDRQPFETLKTTIFPRLFDKRSTDVPIRLWVPGCATGEEAYSIAICLLEYLDNRPAGFKIQIFGTDVDERALGYARQALYPQNIEVDVSPGRLQRFFTKQDKGYQVSRQLRDIVVFARHNLGKDPPFSHLDVISCRNVLIYLQGPLQKRVLRVFHYALNPESFLLLGTSESVGETSDLFSLVDRKLKIYVKKNTASAAVFDFAQRVRVAGQGESSGKSSATEHRAAVNIQQLADRTVLKRFGPPGILVNDQMEIVHFRGQTGPYLAPLPGTATLNVLKLIRPELLVELRVAIQKVKNEGLPATSAPLRLGSDRPAVVLEVMPLQEPGTQQRCILVLFRDLLAAAVPPSTEERTEPDGETRTDELARELLVTKEYLQTTVQDLEASNEELQSSNEELQSSNEELQSTNEELETSKEELQSTNEELGTVNEELQNRMSQLAVSNDDVQNVLAVVSIPVVLVGTDLRIRRFSADAERLLNLIPGDVGRPIAYLGAALGATDLESMVADTINTVRERAQRVRTADGHWYSMRVVPYRTGEHSIRGALIELLRAPPVRPLDEPLEINELVGKVLSTLPHVLVLLDEQLRIVWVNKAFFETFVVGAEILGQPLEEVWPSRAILPELWAALEEAASAGTPFADVWVPHPFGRQNGRPMRFGARCIPAEGERPPLTLVVIEEPANTRIGS